MLWVLLLATFGVLGCCIRQPHLQFLPQGGCSRWTCREALRGQQGPPTLAAFLSSPAAAAHPAAVRRPLPSQRTHSTKGAPLKWNSSRPLHSEAPTPGAFIWGAPLEGLTTHAAVRLLSGEASTGGPLQHQKRTEGGAPFFRGCALGATKDAAAADREEQEGAAGGVSAAAAAAACGIDAQAMRSADLWVDSLCLAESIPKQGESPLATRPLPPPTWQLLKDGKVRLHIQTLNSKPQTLEAAPRREAPRSSPHPSPPLTQRHAAQLGFCMLGWLMAVVSFWNKRA